MAYTTIDDPSVYFQTQLYSSSGGGGTISVTNGGNSDLQPDWLWIKVRNGSNDHNIFDSSRGFQFRTWSNQASAENEGASVSVSSDGFATGTGWGDINNTSGANNYVAWQWKANGGTTTTNDASSTGIGSIDSVYQANTTAGFSIVTYTGTGSTATVAHGLGGVPDMLIFRKRSANDNAYIYHKQLTNDYYLAWETTGARNNDVNIWNDTDPTSTVFSIANAGVHANGATMVCWAFKAIKGYSRFGMYRGNGAADGTFVFTGFKPAWIMIKEYGGNTNDYNIYDNKRSPINPMDHILEANLSDAEGTGRADIDFLSNGFKQRNTHADSNRDGGDFLYMAFAEHPFASSKGVPTTAR